MALSVTGICSCCPCCPQSITYLPQTIEARYFSWTLERIICTEKRSCSPITYMEIAWRVSWNFHDNIQLTKTSPRNNIDDIKGNERMALTASLCKTLQENGDLIWNKNNNHNTIKPVCWNPSPWKPWDAKCIWKDLFTYVFIFFKQKS